MIEPPVPISHYHDVFGNRGGRLLAPAGPMRFWNDAVVEDSGQPDRQNLSAEQHAIEALPDEALPFLLPSRYCEVDRMVDLAWQWFGSTPKTGARVQAICEFVHQHLHFDYLQARRTRTAYEAYQERVGVCRYFTHLAITFCRGLNIPARYCTGYLSDLGVPPTPEPMDFSAWFEAYLGGGWYPFDPRHNTTRIGRVLMARGRDAADVALLTSFGPSRLERFAVYSVDRGSGRGCSMARRDAAGPDLTAAGGADSATYRLGPLPPWAETTPRPRSSTRCLAPRSTPRSAAVASPSRRK